MPGVDDMFVAPGDRDPRSRHDRTDADRARMRGRIDMTDELGPEHGDPHTLAAALDRIRELEAQLDATDVAYLLTTNTSRKSRRAVADSLEALGLSAVPERILTAPLAAAHWLEREGIERVRLLLPESTHEDFGGFEAGNLTRTPKELVCHMTSVLGYARTVFRGGSSRPEPLPTLAGEVTRFHSMLGHLSEHLKAGDELLTATPEQLLQGPFSDAMTHAGQLAMLRRLHGSPVPPENFIAADIDSSNVSENQAEPQSPDSAWPERLP